MYSYNKQIKTTAGPCSVTSHKAVIVYAPPFFHSALCAHPFSVQSPPAWGSLHGGVISTSIPEGLEFSVILPLNKLLMFSVNLS